MIRTVALTGNVAAGKSAVADRLRARGVTVIDADRIVHELQRPGEAVFDAIVARFGPAILAADGQLDRAALRRRVFDDAGARADLERIVHPAVRARREAQVRAAAARGESVVVCDIPLLFEADDPDAYDAVLVVDAPVALRRERLVRLRGLDPVIADRMIAAQMPSEAKRASADAVIDNDADLETLVRRTDEAWERVRQ